MKKVNYKIGNKGLMNFLYPLAHGEYGRVRDEEWTLVKRKKSKRGRELFTFSDGDNQVVFERKEAREALAAIQFLTIK